MSGSLHREISGIGCLYDGKCKIDNVQYSLYSRVAFDEHTFVDGELQLPEAEPGDQTPGPLSLRHVYTLELADGNTCQVNLASIPGGDRLYVVVDCTPVPVSKN